MRKPEGIKLGKYSIFGNVNPADFHPDGAEILGKTKGRYSLRGKGKPAPSRLGHGRIQRRYHWFRTPADPRRNTTPSNRNKIETTLPATNTTPTNQRGEHHTQHIRNHSILPFSFSRKLTFNCLQVRTGLGHSILAN